jgi:hypothetical protein
MLLETYRNTSEVHRKCLGIDEVLVNTIIVIRSGRNIPVRYTGKPWIYDKGANRTYV